jgi:LAS superfamily LD-carboxypeptidase LdcB
VPSKPCPPQDKRSPTQPVGTTKIWVAEPSIARRCQWLVSQLARFRTSLQWGLVWLLSLITASVVLTHHAIAKVTTQASLNQAHSALFEVAQVLRPTPLNLQDAIAASPLPSAAIHEAPRYGHLPYPEVTPDALIAIGSYSQGAEQRYEYLTQAAGLALMKMLDAARLDGIWLVPVSAFRDWERQNTLFQSQVVRLGSAEAAARAVAPPGYSEHHTGLAIDLADGLARAQDISIAFGQTQGFQWLTQHAQEFGFELSFPPDNPQGVNYEPWHWRYVGSSEASQTFSLAQRF